jgi:DNA-binding CsgD family transcriptional regulator
MAHSSSRISAAEDPDCAAAAGGDVTARPDPVRSVRETRFPLSSDEWRRLSDLLGLSPRELEVVQCIFDGGTEQSIARDLNLSAHTVHSHLDRIYKKLCVANRTALTLRVVEVILGMIRAAGNGRGPKGPPDGGPQVSLAVGRPLESPPH